MIKTNSYIFIEHPFVEHENYHKEGETIVLNIGNNVYSFITQSFPSLERVNNCKKLFNTELAGVIECRNVKFFIQEAGNVSYLDISVEGKSNKEIINCLEHIQYILLSSGIRHYYVDIVSFDSISEYYCNLMMKKLNTLERNLRKLLLNIYVLNFGENYYQSTMTNSMQSKIKALIGSSTSDEQIKEIKEQYNVQKKQAELIARLQQFFYSFEFADIGIFLFEPRVTNLDIEARNAFLSKHDNLSNLSDQELREAFSRFSAKSDWDRFFSNKIQIKDIDKVFEEIRKYRNTVAHFKFFNKVDYAKCNKLVNRLNKSILEAIRITEEVDFSKKNSDMIRDAIAGVADRIQNMIAPLADIRVILIKNMEAVIDSISKIY